MSDSLASKIVDINCKKLKNSSDNQIKMPKKDQQEELNDKHHNTVPDMQMFEIFPDFEDDLVQVLTQIEKENEQLNEPEEKNNQKQVAIPQENAPKTVNYSAMTNILNFNQMAPLPHIYFLNSNVTINYNFPK